MAEVPLLNLFPANVVTPAGERRAVRVTVTPASAMVYGLEGVIPKLVETAEVQSFDRPQRRRRGLDPDYTVTTTDGEVWEIRKAGGCGCGSKLRSFNPFGGANRVGT